MIDPETIQKQILPAIARALFAQIDPDIRYVVAEGTSTAFTTARLMRGLPAMVIGDRDRISKPLRDHGIYRITPDGIDHDCIAEGWVNAVLEDGAGAVKLGSEITVGDVWDAAAHEVATRLEQDEPT